MKHKLPIRKQRLVYADERWPQPVFCKTCDGGKMPEFIAENIYRETRLVPCPECGGRGTIVE